MKARDKSSGATDLIHSGGFVVSKENRITTVIWDSPAFDAGLAVGSELLAVNGRSYSSIRLKDTINAANGGRDPIKLLVKSGDLYQTVELGWHDGLRYPRLEKIGKTPSTLDALLTAR